MKVTIGKNTILIVGIPVDLMQPLYEEIIETIEFYKRFSEKK